MKKNRISRRSALQLLGGASMGLLAAATSHEAVAAASAIPRLSPAASVNPRPVGTSTTAARVDRDIAYGPDGAMKLDIHYSDVGLRPAPMIVFIHGGAFTTGDKRGVTMLPELAELLSRGYNVASINYRLNDASRFPNAVQDAMAAVRFLRLNAAQYGVAPDRFGAWGRSVGGYLVSMIGLTHPEDGFEAGNNTDVSSQVQAVVEQFGVSSFNERNPLLKLEEFLGPDGISNPDLLKKASALTYITPDAPPFLAMHGDMDKLAPIFHSQNLVNNLKAAGVSAQLVVVRNAGHNFEPAGTAVISPSETEIAQMVGEFFDKQLKP